MQTINTYKELNGEKMQGAIEELAEKLGKLPAGEPKPLVCSIETLSHCYACAEVD